MKRIILLFLVLFLGTNLVCEERFVALRPRQDLSGISIYNDFILSLQSGIVNKITVDTGGLYELLDTRQETIIFNRQENKLHLSYRSRLPVVPFSWPTPDYYDSNRYYYKVGNDWFYDRFGYYTEKVQAQYLRFPDELLTGCDVLEDVVLVRRDGYDIRLVTSPRNSEVRNNIEMKCDRDMVIRKIDIEITKPESATKYFKIRYRRVNENVPVSPPKDLPVELLSA